MDNFIRFIIPDGVETFTPEVLIRYMVFVLILSTIGSIANSLLKVGERN